MNPKRNVTLEKKLIGNFGLTTERANALATQLTEEAFDLETSRLSSLVGEQITSRAVREGTFAEEIIAGRGNEYFQLAYTVYGTMKPSLPIPHIPFRSTATLLTYLGIEEDKAEEIREEFTPGLWKLLNRGNSKSRSYLNTLIDKGELQVSDNERWDNSRAGASSAIAGVKIIKHIAYELPRIFEQLKLGRPRHTTDIGRGTIKLPKESQESLRTARDIAYSSQS